jgi:hypothetical protein
LRTNWLAGEEKQKRTSRTKKQRAFNCVTINYEFQMRIACVVLCFLGEAHSDRREAALD